jgi:hypothetical protein
MTPRKAFVVGSLLLAGFGALIVGEFGTKIYLWYLTGDLWIMSRSGLGQYASYSKFPVEVAIVLGIYALFVGVGIVCLGAALINPVYRWRHLLRRD